MEQKNNIEKLFKDSFAEYEEPVRPELWDNISSNINSGPKDTNTNNDSVSTGGSENIVSGSQGLGLGFWGGAAALVVTASTLYFAFNYTSDESQTPVMVKDEIAAESTVNPPNQEISADQILIESEIAAEPAKEGIDAPVSSSENLIEEPVIESEKLVENKPVNNTEIETAPSQLSSSENPVPDDIEKVGQTQTDPVINNIKDSELPTEVHSQPDRDNNTANFNLTANPTKGVAPVDVNLNLASFQGEVTWDFGDGASGFGGGTISHQYEIPGTYTAIAKFIDSDGIAQDVAVTITVEADEFLKNFIPNIFTPNGDGINDIFTIKSSKLKSLEVNIYDWRGRQVANFTDAETGWDGNIAGGNLAPEGTYFYVIFATGNDFRTYNYKGTLKLVR